MAVVHEAVAKLSIVDAILTDIGNAGYLQFETTADAEVSKHTFPTPSGTTSGDTLTFTCGAGISDTSPAGGEVAQASMYTSGDAKIFEATGVGTAGPDITISSTTIAVTDTVTLTALTYTSPS